MGNTISVYIPTHNRPLFLDRALNSLVQQSYKNFQVLVCDDGSSSSYEDVVNKYKNKFENFVFVRNATPKGACFSRNRLIQIADGEYITGLDDDDEFLPSRLEDFLGSKKLGQYAYLCSGFIMNTTKGLIKKPMKTGLVTLPQLLNKNIVGNQIFIKREDFVRAGCFDISLPAWQDYDAWVRVTQLCGNGYKINKLNYKMNIDHEEGRISNSPKAKIGYEMFINKHSSILNKENLANLYLQDKINRNENISIVEFARHYSSSAIPLYIKYQINKKMPFVKRILYKVNGV
ncbi:glycosyltransferase [Sodalis sp. RH24]|uniref:glycosyltransferase n=1 Tax=unclassified Sodalis (in: enterobacteria) TaxID=2636512 RepID=UPI0039B6A1F3